METIDCVTKLERKNDSFTILKSRERPQDTFFENPIFHTFFGDAIDISKAKCKFYDKAILKSEFERQLSYVGSKKME